MPDGVNDGWRRESVSNASDQPLNRVPRDRAARWDPVRMYRRLSLCWQNPHQRSMALQTRPFNTLNATADFASDPHRVEEWSV